MASSISVAASSLTVVLVLITGCGSGGGGNTTPTTTTPTPPPGDFTLSASPSNATVAAGSSQIVTISAMEVNSFASSISVAANDLPSGVTVSPASFTLTPGNQVQVTIAASQTVQPGTASITFQGTAGNLAHSASFSLTLETRVTGQYAPFRTRYLRTNGYIDPNSMGSVPPHFSVYDPANKRFFVSNPFMNEIDVFDATQEIEIGQIPVPLAWGIDVSPYNGNLYSGSLIGDVYQIDADQLSIIKRYPSASIGPNGYIATEAFVLSDGRLALQGAWDPIDSAAAGAAVWDPVANTLDVDGCNFGGYLGAFAVSGDRTRLLETPATTSSSLPLCSYDPVAKTSTMVPFPTPGGGWATFIVPTPDGKRFFLFGPSNIYVFDAHTVQLLGQVQTPIAALSAPPAGIQGAVMSLDGKTLYFSLNQVVAIDTTSLAPIGWVSNFNVYDGDGSVAGSAVDENGLMIGPTGHGVGFIDVSQLLSAEPTSLNPGIITTATGPESGGTLISDADYWPFDTTPKFNVFVGNAAAGDLSLVSSTVGLGPQLSTPPSLKPGPVDLSLTLGDGGIGISPEGFSYGPSILEVVPNGATADGGQTGTLIGYGFGTDAMVTVGGKSAPITAVIPHPIVTPYPYPVDAVQFTIPAGSPGTAVDVTVTTASGTATAPAAFHYTAAAESYPLNASLQAGIYDAHRDLYYFTDTSQIQVLSRSGGKWIAPITLPGVVGATRLLTIAESPDGSQMAVSDVGGNAIYLLDPDNPAAAQRFSMPVITGFANQLDPTGLAVTNDGSIYFEADDPAPASAFHKLDPSTGAIQSLGNLMDVSANAQSTRILITPDGTQIYANIGGIVFRLLTANDQLEMAPTYAPGEDSFPELSVSGDGSTTSAAGYITDPALGIETIPAYIDWETWFPTGLNGQKLNHDGSILFQPLTDGVDLIARNTGRLLYRIQIPGTIAAVYDPLVVGPGQNTLATITATGVYFADLSSLPIPAQYTQPFPQSGQSAMRASSAVQPSRHARVGARSLRKLPSMRIQTDRR